ncbi:MAG TPA: Rpn family recombination-promoting nuclease/putative transposase [Thermoanaerobaculia bacterium]
MAPHDPLFKSLLRAFFAGFLRLIAPDLAARLDLGAVAFLDKELISSPERSRVVDLLARVALREESGKSLLVHVEIESRARRGMGTRLRDYHRAIQARHEDPVLSIVVYLKGGPAGICEQELDGDLKAPGLTSFRYLSFGLSRCLAEEYLAQPEPLAWALAALMRRGGLSKVELKMRCFARLAEATLKDEERRELANCIETYLELTPEEVEEMSLLDTSQTRRTQAMSLLYKVSWADKMRLEGRRQGAQDMLLHLLEERFGPVPEEVRSRVESIQSLERLKRLFSKAMIAKSLKGLRLG